MPDGVPEDGAAAGGRSHASAEAPPPKRKAPDAASPVIGGAFKRALHESDADVSTSAEAFQTARGPASGSAATTTAPLPHPVADPSGHTDVTSIGSIGSVETTSRRASPPPSAAVTAAGESRSSARASIVSASATESNDAARRPGYTLADVHSPPPAPHHPTESTPCARRQDSQHLQDLEDGEIMGRDGADADAASVMDEASRLASDQTTSAPGSAHAGGAAADGALHASSHGHGTPDHARSLGGTPRTRTPGEMMVGGARPGTATTASGNSRPGVAAPLSADLFKSDPTSSLSSAALNGARITINKPLSGVSSPILSKTGSPLLGRLKPPSTEPLPDRSYHGFSDLSAYTMSKEKVGEGTFGEVTRATCKSTGQQVALKKILMHNEKEGIPITALREIRILKALHHTCIIELVEMVHETVKVASTSATQGHDLQTIAANKRTRGAMFMSFPYMEHDLAGLLQNPDVVFYPDQIKSFMQQLLRGTWYLHRNAILHRDMKSANILINNRGELKIADFGLARTYDPSNPGREYTNLVVTRWYRPPELLLGAVCYDSAVDMWGVGCVFGEILTRIPVFQGRSDFQQLDTVFSVTGTPNQQTWPNHVYLPVVMRDDPATFQTVHKRDVIGFFERHYRNSRRTADPEALSLVDQLLVNNPAERLSAEQALDHLYFHKEPKPRRTGPGFADWAASHELDARNRRDQEMQEFGNRRHRILPPHPDEMPPSHAWDGALAHHGSRANGAKLGRGGSWHDRGFADRPSERGTASSVTSTAASGAGGLATASNDGGFNQGYRDELFVASSTSAARQGSYGGTYGRSDRGGSAAATASALPSTARRDPPRPMRHSLPPKPGAPNITSP